MKIAYFDCFSGISGDMTLAALLDLGIDKDALFKTLYSLPIDFEVELKTVKRSQISATQVKVVSKEKKILRSWQNIEKIVRESSLEQDIKENALKAFGLLVDVESRVHRIPTSKVHLHEIGAVDTVVDIVGSMLGIKLLNVNKIYCSPIATGYGVVKTEHGTLPVPSPATLEILKGAPIYSSTVPAELTTPTGAAIIKTVCDEFTNMPRILTTSVGYGAGQRQLEQHPNLLRLIIGETEEPKLQKENLLVISANIDDLNPELFGNLINKLMEAGAKDAWLSPITMKKGRQGVCVNALVEQHAKGAVLETLFKEGSSLGVRIHPVERVALPRKTLKVAVAGQTIKVKIGMLDSEVVNIAPEYEDCLKASEKSGIPLKTIYQQAVTEAQKQLD